MVDGAAFIEDHRAMLETFAAEHGVGSTILPTLAMATEQLELAQAQLEQAEPSDRDQVVVLRQTLGEGGMGVVRLGTQVSLGRDVAVKGIRPEHAGPVPTTKLVQEAWVTGSLEHPNIVPIYDLSRDQDGLPMLVMRRIEGVPWSALIDDPEAVRERFGAADPLDWNLRVLMQLASALHFAHGRGIVHLDLKPDNVMIGPLGEVYLVDWGLAMTLRDDPRLPSARANKAIIGTPAFVAPEMLTGDGELLSPQTDVYLLGSTLYALLAGRPPHRGESLMAVLFCSLQGTPPPLPDGVEAELEAVVRRAMAREPADRYASAEEFRLAVQDFLQHRGALALVARADDRRAELEALVERHAVDGVVAAASEARFGYQQALDTWPDSAAARAGLDRATGLYAIWSAKRGELATAEGLAEQLIEPSAAVEAALVQAIERQEEDARRLRALEAVGRDVDARTGQRTRSVLLGAVSVFAVFPAILSLFVEGIASWPAVLAFPIVGTLLLTAVAVWGRESLSASRVNRAGDVTLLAMMGGQFAITAGGWRAGLDFDLTMSLVFPVWSLTAVTWTIAMDRRIWPGAVVYAVCTVVAVLWPAAWIIASAVANVAVLLVVRSIWRSDEASASLPR